MPPSFDLALSMTLLRLMENLIWLSEQYNDYVQSDLAVSTALLSFDWAFPAIQLNLHLAVPNGFDSVVLTIPRSAGLTLLATLTDPVMYWTLLYLNQTSLIPNLSDTDPSDTKSIWYHTRLQPNPSDSEPSKSPMYQISNVQIPNLSDTKPSDTEHVRNHTYQIPQPSDTEHMRYQTCQIPNLADAESINTKAINTKPIRYPIYQMPSLSDTKPYI